MSGVDGGEWSSAEADRRFLRLFGVSRDELRRQGLDAGQYAREHAKERVASVYSDAEKRLRSRESLLPYWAPSAWVGVGRTRLKGGPGSVDVSPSSIHVADMSGTTAQLSPRDLSVRSVTIWFGLGVCLVVGDQRWFIQPWYSPTSPRRGWKANRVFRRALQEAVTAAR